MAVLGFRLAAVPSFHTQPRLLPVGLPTALRGAVGETAFTMFEAGWIDRIGAFVQGQTVDSYASLGVWTVTEPTGADRLIAWTNVFFLNPFAPVEHIGDSVLHPLILAGTPLAVGGTVYQGGMFEVNADTRLSFNQNTRTSGGVQFNTDPFHGGGTVVNTNGITPFGIFIEYTPNRAPNAPTDITVAGNSSSGVTITTVTPTFTFAFSDADQIAGYADKIQRYAFRVKDTDTGMNVWPLAGQETLAQFAATPANQVTGATISRPYPGATVGSAALVSGGNYSLEIQTQDLAGDWGAYSTPFLFAMAEIGAVSVDDGTPFGKIDAPADDIDYTARWHHPANNATTDVQVELLQNGAIWRTGAEVAKIVASSALPGSAFTITMAESGIGELPRGQDFTYRIRARSGGIWTSYSPERAFRTNAPPTTPVPVSPVDGEQVAPPPLLIAMSSDPDTDDIMGADVVWEILLTRPSPLSQLSFEHPTDEMTYNGELSQVSYELDATDCPNTGLYLWEVRAIDLSAEAELAGYGTSDWSAPQSFNLQAGPQPTLILPAATVATVSPLYRFTVANGPSVRYRVVVYLYGTTTRVWDSQEVASTGLDVVQPAGYLRNGIKYDVQVTVWNGTNQFGTSQRRAFTVAFTAPDAIANVSALPWSASRDPEPTALVVGWDRTVLPAAEFVCYVVRRRLSGQAPEAATLLRAITNPAQTRWWDYNAPPGVPLIYSVSQQRRGGSGAGTPIIEGPQTDIEARLDLGVIVVADALQPDTFRVVLDYLPVSIDSAPRQNQAPYTTWGSNGLPTMISSPGTQEVITVSGTFDTDSNATQADLDAMFNTLVQMQGISCYRDERRRVFGKITNPRLSPGTEFEPDRVSFTIEQTNYREGQG